MKDTGADRYETKKVALFCATIASPFVAYLLDIPAVGPYAFAFFLVMTFAHIVDRSIDDAVRRARDH